MTVIGALTVQEDVATGQRKGGVLRVVAGEFEESMVRHAVDDPADSGPISSTRAHHTRLGTRVQSRVIHLVGPKHAPCTGAGDDLCMLCRVTIALGRRVASFDDHLAVGIGDQGAIRSASAVPRLIGQHEGSPKQREVGHIIRVGLTASRYGTDEGRSDHSDKSPSGEQNLTPLQLLDGRPCYPSRPL